MGTNIHNPSSMEKFETWTEALMASLYEMSATLVGFLPNLLAALVVLILGIIVAASLGKLVAKLIELTRVDLLLDKLGINKASKSIGKIKVSGILGWLVKWFLIIVVLMGVAEILGLVQIIDFLYEVARYLPNVIIAIVILLIGIVAGNFVYEIVHRAVNASKMHSPRALANLAKWGIIIFALVPAIKQLGVDTSMVEILFTGLVAMLALAGGIAFGLGGKESAGKWLEEIKKKF